VHENFFAIRNNTTGRYFTETNGNLRHEARISGTGTDYDVRQVWIILQQPNGMYRIRSASSYVSPGDTLYAQDDGFSVTLASRSTSHNRQLWRIGHIWHIDNSQYHRDWFGFWGGQINIRSATVGTQADGFNFLDRMGTARNAWANALDIEFNIITNVDTAVNIRAYGGCRHLIQERVEDRDTPFCPNNDRHGVALMRAAIDGGAVGTIQTGGVTRNVFRFRDDDPAPAMIIAVFSNSGRWNTFDSRNINFATMAAMHELGHALGYFGHSPNSNDVMVGDTSWLLTPNVTLNPAEIEHLRQIYGRFRN